jgi:hypothetical protein
VKWYFILSALLFLLGGCSVASSFVVQERLTHVPHLTCDQLLQQGPPADGQVLVTDLCAYREAIGTRYDGSLEAYAPAYSAGLPKEPTPPELKFLLQVWDDDAYDRLYKQPTAGEMACWANRTPRFVEVCGGPGQIPTWVREHLEKKYPGIRLAHLMVLSIGHGSTPTPEQVESAWNYGVGELVLGAAVLAFATALAWRRRGHHPAESLP